MELFYMTPNEKKATETKLLAKDGVVSVGQGFKRVNGKDTNIPCLVIGVRRKKPLQELKKRDVVPKKIKGIATDVIEVGEIRILSHTGRMRPAVPGISIGHYQVTAGTFGCVVRRGSERFILSNNHVLANVNEAAIGDPILQPGAYDGGALPNDEIGQLEDFIPIVMSGLTDCQLTNSIVSIFNRIAQSLRRSSRIYSYALPSSSNTVDCAIAKPSTQEDISGEILGIGAPTGTGLANVGDQVRKVGRTTELTTGVVSQVKATVSVNMGDSRMATFEDQIMVEGNFSEGGDSGSLVLKDMFAVGLLFAGGSGITVVNDIHNVLDSLGVSI